LAFSPDGRWVAGGDDDKVLLWGMAREVRTLAGHTAPVRCLAFSADGRWLVSGGEDWTCKLWDVATGELLHTFREHADAVLHVAFAPRTAELISATLDQVKVADLRRARLPLVIAEEGGARVRVAFSPDGRRLAFIGGRGTTAAGVKVRDVVGEQHPTLGQTVASAVAYGPDGRRLAAAGGGTVTIWDAATGREVRKIELTGQPASVNCLTFSPDGSRLAAFGNLGEVLHLWRDVGKVWDVGSGAEVCNCRDVAQGEVEGVAFSPDGTRLAATWARLPYAGVRQSQVRICDAATGEVLASLPGKAEDLTGVAFSPDGKWLAAGDKDGTVKVWDWAARELRWTLEGHTASVNTVAFSPDGRRLVSGSGGDKLNPVRPGEVKLWDPATGEELLSLREGRQRFEQVSFSTDGTRLFGAGAGKVLVWDGAPAGKGTNRRGE
jgi:WD40 repeat protein